VNNAKHGCTWGFAIMMTVAAPALASTWYQDLDGDNYGNCNVTIEAPSQPVGYVAICGDCSDANASIHPGAVEIPGDGIDQDCNGMEACYRDADNDGYGTPVLIVSVDLDCFDFGEEPSDTSDCDDNAPSIHPGAVEIPNNGIDEDCNGSDLTVPVPLEGTSWSLLKARYR
jgi:hypothetical protein